MDTVTVKTLIDVGKQFITEAFKQSPTTGNGYGYLVALLVLVVIYTAIREWIERRDSKTERKEAREYRDKQDKRWEQQRTADEKRWQAAEQLKEQRREVLFEKLDGRFDKLEQYTDATFDQLQEEIVIGSKAAQDAFANLDKRVSRLEWESAKTPPKTGG